MEIAILVNHILHIKLIALTNFAYKDHFIGALKTKQPYLSNVFKAVTTGEPLAILASPIYADVKNRQSLIGVQVLGLNFSYFNYMIKSIIPTTTEASNIALKLSGLCYYFHPMIDSQLCKCTSQSPDFLICGLNGYQ